MEYAEELNYRATDKTKCQVAKKQPGSCRTCSYMGIRPQLCCRADHGDSWCVCEHHRCVGFCARDCGRRCVRPMGHWLLSEEDGFSEADRPQVCLCATHSDIVIPDGLPEEGHSFEQCVQHGFKPQLTTAEHNRRAANLRADPPHYASVYSSREYYEKKRRTRSSSAGKKSRWVTGLSSMHRDARDQRPPP